VRNVAFAEGLIRACALGHMAVAPTEAARSWGSQSSRASWRDVTWRDVTCPSTHLGGGEQAVTRSPRGLAGSRSTMAAPMRCSSPPGPLAPRCRARPARRARAARVGEPPPPARTRGATMPRARAGRWRRLAPARPAAGTGWCGWRLARRCGRTRTAMTWCRSWCRRRRCGRHAGPCAAAGCRGVTRTPLAQLLRATAGMSDVWRSCFGRSAGPDRGGQGGASPCAAAGARGRQARGPLATRRGGAGGAEQRAAGGAGPGGEGAAGSGRRRAGLRCPALPAAMSREGGGALRSTW
jgi:hypothetical protein